MARSATTSRQPARRRRPRESRGRRRKKIEPGLGLPAWLDPTRLPPYDTSTRVSPPLRGEEDVEALIEGLRDGTIDAIATDHAPHSQVDKECEYRLAAPGISGLETALGLVLTLVHRGEMDLVNMVAKLTEGPASVLRRAPATLRPGNSADIVVFDPDTELGRRSRRVRLERPQHAGAGPAAQGPGYADDVSRADRLPARQLRRGHRVLQQASKLEGILNE